MNISAIVWVNSSKPVNVPVFPIALKYATPVTACRVALVGNAAQTLHPVAGQGFNLGLRDAWELAEEIIASPAEIGKSAMLAQIRPQAPDGQRRGAYIHRFSGKALFQ